ncbi:ferritin-like domain-containing protein [Thiohalorhabdus methylotrophus]|uniref:DUF2202 domain-containing protein n=1 Tax=Thiohalorhabdus methylotrophus TaxID=3242694 RepID=A0ABV4U0Z5_9GAMM
MSDLTAPEIHALHEALDDEYRAWATYDQVLDDFGPVRPFSKIREAEARHIEALCTLFARYDLPIPDNPWPGKVDRYDSLRDACKAGVGAEIANGRLYDRLLHATAREDILAVFRNLQEASQQRHLPAFQRCAQGSVGGRGGAGRHRGGRERA